MPTAMIPVLAFLGLISVVEEIQTPDDRTSRPTTVAIEDILTEWKQRQARLRQVTIRLEEHQFLSQGALLNSSMSETENPEGLTYPEEELEIRRTETLILDGDLTRQERDGPVFSRRRWRFVPDRMIRVFDGKEVREYHAGLDGPPTGSITRGPLQIRNSNHIPLNLFARPVAGPFLHPPLKEFRIQDKEVVIRGTRCLHLVRTVRAYPKPFEQNLFLALAPGYPLVRYTVQGEGTLSLQVDVTKSREWIGSLAPVQWKAVWTRRDGTHLYTYRLQADWAGLEEPISSEVFSLPFPEKTWVVDNVRQTMYLVRDKNRKRVITKEEYGASYERLLATESGMAFRKSASSSWKAVAAVALVLALVVGLLAVAFRVWQLRFFEGHPN